MKVDLALLCDAVTVRDGLLHILGGGVTRLSRASYPAPLLCQVALRLALHQTEATATHAVRVVIIDEDGHEIAKVEGQVANDPAGLASMHAGETMYASIGLPLGGVVLPRPGTYAIEILVDDSHARTVSFRAE